MEDREERKRRREERGGRKKECECGESGSWKGWEDGLQTIIK